MIEPSKLYLNNQCGRGIYTRELVDVIRGVHQRLEHVEGGNHADVERVLSWLEEQINLKDPA